LDKTVTVVQRQIALVEDECRLRLTNRDYPGEDYEAEHHFSTDVGMRAWPFNDILSLVNKEESSLLMGFCGDNTPREIGFRGIARDITGNPWRGAPPGVASTWSPTGRRPDRLAGHQVAAQIQLLEGHASVGVGLHHGLLGREKAGNIGLPLSFSVRAR
jgi:hypothetical protein